MRSLAREPADRFPDAGAFAEALRVWRRNPDAAAPFAAGATAAAGAAVATTPPAGEPTVYVPPRVTRPADRVPVAPPPRRVDVYPRDRDEGQPWWIWLLAVLAVFLLGAIGFLAVQLLGGGGPTATPSPSVALVTIPECEDASATILTNNLIQLGLEVDEERENSDEVEEGDVIRCEPGSGEEVEVGETVTVFISSGEETVAVPPLRGQTLDQAERTLEREELALGTVSQEPDPSIPEGAVIRSNPTEGTDVPIGSPVDLIISTGPTPSPTPSPSPTPTLAPTPTPVPTLPPIIETPAPTPPGGG